MTHAFKTGDHVSWKTPQGETRGEVVRVVREHTHLGGHAVAASPDAPQYEVKSISTGKHAIHRAAALTAV
ncbi:MAG: DUF2945 domain-containing protein [Janthinobacterium lividum]